MLPEVPGFDEILKLGYFTVLVLIGIGLRFSYRFIDHVDRMEQRIQQCERKNTEHDAIIRMVLSQLSHDE